MARRIVARIGFYVFVLLAVYAIVGAWSNRPPNSTVWTTSAVAFIFAAKYAGEQGHE